MGLSGDTEDVSPSISAGKIRPTDDDKNRDARCNDVLRRFVGDGRIPVFIQMRDFLQLTGLFERRSFRLLITRPTRIIPRAYSRMQGVSLRSTRRSGLGFGRGVRVLVIAISAVSWASAALGCWRPAGWLSEVRRAYVYYRG